MRSGELSYLACNEVLLSAMAVLLLLMFLLSLPWSYACWGGGGHVCVTVCVWGGGGGFHTGCGRSPPLQVTSTVFSGV